MKHKTLGFSLVEALVTLTVLAIVVAALVPLFGFFASTNKTNEIRTEAVVAAQQVMNRLRQQGPRANWVPSGYSETINSGLRDYEVTTTYCEDGLSLCSVTATHVRVDVKFNQEIYYSVETVYTDLD